MKNISKFLGIILFVIHGILAVWALMGFTELFVHSPPWKPISNYLFPDSILFLQWLFVLTAACIFIFGYLYKWRLTPIMMTFAYGAMATLCAVETFGFLEHDTRFLDMVIEYLAYVIILLFLFKSKYFQAENVSS